MDIEGSELKTLMGAEQTIKKINQFWRYASITRKMIYFGILIYI